MAQMELIIPGGNIKILSRAIATLAKIGDDLYLEAAKDGLQLRSMNMSTTAYCMVTLCEAFFTTYEITNGDNVQCKIPMKGIVGVFKSHGNKDKQPEFCKVELEEDATKIFFKFRYKHQVNIMKMLFLSEGDTVKVTYNRDKCTNVIGGGAQVFAQVLSNFQVIDEDLSIELNSNKALIRNYIAGDSRRITKGIRSQFTLTAKEFATYQIDGNVSVTFAQKPFRAAVHFAEMQSMAVLLTFGSPGRPALVEMKNAMLTFNVIIATLRTDEATQSSVVTETRPELENVNWDDFNEPMDVTSDNVVLPSPESPRTKKIKYIFGRCYDDTFCTEAVDLGKVLAPDSDPDSD